MKPMTVSIVAAQDVRPGDRVLFLRDGTFDVVTDVQAGKRLVRINTVTRALAMKHLQLVAVRTPTFTEALRSAREVAQDADVPADVRQILGQLASS